MGPLRTCRRAPIFANLTSKPMIQSIRWLAVGTPITFFNPNSREMIPYFEVSSVLMGLNSLPFSSWCSKLLSEWPSKQNFHSIENTGTHYNTTYWTACIYFNKICAGHFTILLTHSDSSSVILSCLNVICNLSSWFQSQFGCKQSKFNP